MVDRGGIDSGVQTRRGADAEWKLGEGDTLRGVVFDRGLVEAVLNECLNHTNGVFDGDAELRRVFERLPEDVARMVRNGDVVRAEGIGKLGGRAGEPGGACFDRLLVHPAPAMGNESPVRRGDAAAPGAGRPPQPALAVRIRGMDR